MAICHVCMKSGGNTCFCIEEMAQRHDVGPLKWAFLGLRCPFCWEVSSSSPQLCGFIPKGWAVRRRGRPSLKMTPKKWCGSIPLVLWLQWLQWWPRTCLLAMRAGLNMFINVRWENPTQHHPSCGKGETRLDFPALGVWGPSMWCFGYFGFKESYPSWTSFQLGLG